MTKNSGHKLLVFFKKTQKLEIKWDTTENIKFQETFWKTTLSVYVNTAIQENFKTSIIIELLSITELHYVGAAKWEYCTLLLVIK